MLSQMLRDQEGQVDLGDLVALAVPTRKTCVIYGIMESDTEIKHIFFSFLPRNLSIEMKDPVHKSPAASCSVLIILKVLTIFTWYVSGFHASFAFLLLLFTHNAVFSLCPS